MGAAPTASTSVSRTPDAHASLSLLPRTAVTGAIVERRSSTLGSPMSPAWMMKSLPWSAANASGRRSPWVSEIKPTDIDDRIVDLGIRRGLVKHSVKSTPVRLRYGTRRLLLRAAGRLA